MNLKLSIIVLLFCVQMCPTWWTPPLRRWPSKVAKRSGGAGAGEQSEVVSQLLIVPLGAVRRCGGGGEECCTCQYRACDCCGRGQEVVVLFPSFIPHCSYDSVGIVQAVVGVLVFVRPLAGCTRLACNLQCVCTVGGTPEREVAKPVNGLTRNVICANGPPVFAQLGTFSAWCGRVRHDCSAGFISDRARPAATMKGKICRTKGRKHRQCRVRMAWVQVTGELGEGQK